MSSLRLGIEVVLDTVIVKDVDEHGNETFETLPNAEEEFAQNVEKLDFQAILKDKTEDMEETMEIMIPPMVQIRDKLFIALEENRLLMEIVNRLIHSTMDNPDVPASQALITVSHAPQRFQEVQNSFKQRIGDAPYVLGATKEHLTEAAKVLSENAQDLLETLQREHTFFGQNALDLRANGWIIQARPYRLVVDYSYKNAGSTYPEVGEATLIREKGESKVLHVDFHDKPQRVIINVNGSKGSMWSDWEKARLGQGLTSILTSAQSTLFQSELFATIMNQVKAGLIGMSTPHLHDRAITLTTVGGDSIHISWQDVNSSDTIDLESAGLELEAESRLVALYRKRIKALRQPGVLWGTEKEEPPLLSSLTNRLVHKRFASKVFDLFESFVRYLEQCGVKGQILYSSEGDDTLITVIIYGHVAQKFTLKKPARLLYTPIHKTTPVMIDLQTDVPPLLSEALREGIVRRICKEAMISQREVVIGPDDVEPWKIVVLGRQNIPLGQVVETPSKDQFAGARIELAGQVLEIPDGTKVKLHHRILKVLSKAMK